MAASTRDSGVGDFPVVSSEEMSSFQADGGGTASDDGMVRLVKKANPRPEDSDEDSEPSSPNMTWDNVKYDLDPVTEKDCDNMVQDSRITKELSVVENDNVYPQTRSPQVNCPERIVICIDLCSEMEDIPFTFSDGSQHSPLFLVKRVVELFVHNKHKIDRRHEFALVIFHEQPLWIKNFTNDPKEICNLLEDLHETRHCETCNLTSLFSAISENTRIPKMRKGEALPPPFLVRTILIYGRSRTVPVVHSCIEVLKSEMQTQYFFLDILYIHEPLSEDDRCQEIFDSFIALDEELTSYVFEVSRNATKLHNCMAKLLSHPLQRPHQHLAHYKLADAESSS